VINQKGLDLLSKMDDCERQIDELLRVLTLEEVQQLNYLLDKIRG